MRQLRLMKLFCTENVNMWAKNCLIYHLRVVEFMKTLSAIYAGSLRYLSQYKGEEGGGEGVYEIMIKFLIL